MRTKDGPIYMCDPEKNTKCKKTGCYINGGGCRRTRHPEFAKEVTEEHMNDHWNEWAEEMTGCNGDSCPIGGAHAVERMD